MNSKFDFEDISSTQKSFMGDLQRLLRQGEYVPFSSAPIFESKFVEVNQRGEPISVHNRPSCVIIGISAVNPSSPIPDTMLVAHKVPVSPQESMTNFWKLSEQPSRVEEIALARVFPLKFVELSVHSTEKHRLMLKLVNGHSYYLELCAPPNQQQHLFHLWLQLISLMKPPQKIHNTEVDVKCKDLGTSCKKALSPDHPSKKRNNSQDVPNHKGGEEVTKETSSKQVCLSGTVGPTEESGSKVQDFHSIPKPTKQETTMQSKNIHPVDTKKSKSTKKSKTRRNAMKQNSRRRLQTSGNQETDHKSRTLFQVLSQMISKKE